MRSPIRIAIRSANADRPFQRVAYRRVASISSASASAGVKSQTLAKGAGMALRALLIPCPRPSLAAFTPVHEGAA
jgi:hypothetical protein